MLDIIRQLLVNLLDRIDSGTCQLTYKQQQQTINLLKTLLNPNTQFTKGNAADYLGISISSFEKLVAIGLIPQGKPLDANQKTKYWELYDLDEYLASKNA